MTGMATYGVLLHALVARNHAWQNIEFECVVSFEWLEPLDTNKTNQEMNFTNMPNMSTAEVCNSIHSSRDGDLQLKMCLMRV